MSIREQVSRVFCGDARIWNTAFCTCQFTNYIMYWTVSEWPWTLRLLIENIEKVFHGVFSYCVIVDEFVVINGDTWTYLNRLRSGIFKCIACVHLGLSVLGAAGSKSNCGFSNFGFFECQKFWSKFIFQHFFRLNNHCDYGEIMQHWKYPRGFRISILIVQYRITSVCLKNSKKFCYIQGSMRSRSKTTHFRWPN